MLILHGTKTSAVLDSMLADLFPPEAWSCCEVPGWCYSVAPQVAPRAPLRCRPLANLHAGSSSLISPFFLFLPFCSLPLHPFLRVLLSPPVIYYALGFLPFFWWNVKYSGGSLRFLPVNAKKNHAVKYTKKNDNIRPFEECWRPEAFEGNAAWSFQRRGVHFNLYGCVCV
jgi:hypothetical protein